MHRLQVQNFSMAFFPFILDVKFVGCTSRGHTGGRSHRISHPHLPSVVDSLPLFFSREGFSRSVPSSTVKSNFATNDLIVLHMLGIFFFFFFVRNSNSRPNVSEGYEVIN